MRARRKRSVEQIVEEVGRAQADAAPVTFTIQVT
jgi:hypothetical protein